MTDWFDSLALPVDSGLWAADRRKKSAAKPRSSPIKRASNAMRRSASRSPLGPASISSFQALRRYRRPSAVILWSRRRRGPDFPGRMKRAFISRVSAGIVAPGNNPAAVFSSYGVDTPHSTSASTKTSRSVRRRLSRFAGTSTSIRRRQLAPKWTRRHRFAAPRLLKRLLTDYLTRLLRCLGPGVLKRRSGGHFGSCVSRSSDMRSQSRRSPSVSFSAFQILSRSAWSSAEV